MGLVCGPDPAGPAFHPGFAAGARVFPLFPGFSGLGSGLNAEPLQLLSAGQIHASERSRTPAI
jgi:hypothetical protein